MNPKKYEKWSTRSIVRAPADVSGIFLLGEPKIQSCGLMSEGERERHMCCPSAWNWNKMRHWQ